MADEDEQPEKKSGPGIIVIAGVALIAAAAGGGGAYFLAPTPATAAASPQSDNADDHDADQKDKARKKKKNSKDKKKPGKKSAHGKSGDSKGKSGAAGFSVGELKIIGDAALFEMKPMVISINPIATSRHLKVGLVIETKSEYADMLVERAFHVRDVLNTYLRSVDMTEFEDPSAMPRLRAQLLRRTRLIAPDAHVDSVLITEFILT